MDQPLSSSREQSARRDDRRDDRRDYSSQRGGGGGGGYRRGGGYGGGRGGGGYRGGGRGGGGRGGSGRGGYQANRQQPYSYTNDNRRGGAGGGRGGFEGNRRYAGNRFEEPLQPRDRQAEALRTLQAMLNSVGELKASPSPVTTDSTPTLLRPVVANQARNVQSMTNAVCDRAELFLEPRGRSSSGGGIMDVRMLDGDLTTTGDMMSTAATIIQAEDQAGPLAAGLVHSVAVWPLQTPCYVALTLAVHNKSQKAVVASSSSTSSTAAAATAASTFAGRCVQYAVRLMARDLDSVLLIPQPAKERVSGISNSINDVVLATSSNMVNNDSPARAVQRVRLTLRYFCLLAKIGIIQSTGGLAAGSDDPVPAATNNQAVTLSGLLESLVQAAIQALDRHQNLQASLVLALLVLGSLPYADLPHEFLQEHLLQPLERILSSSYFSAFAPGVGRTAILLKDEQLEDVKDDQEDDDDDDEEEDDEEVEDEEESSGQVCDSLQDLLRSVQVHLKNTAENVASAKTRFALFADAPWEGLLDAPTSTTSPSDMVEVKPDEGNDAESETNKESHKQTSEGEGEPVRYQDEPLTLNIFPDCTCLTMMLGGQVTSPETAQLSKSISLDGIVVGRLPIFGSPPEAAGDDDDEEDMQDDAAQTPANQRLNAYRKEYGLVDRYFLAEAVRDCLVSHESSVSDAGVVRGSVKTAAEEVWSLGQLVLGEANNEADKTQQQPRGMEFIIVEVVLSLMVQSSMTTSSLDWMYLSRVLLELVKLNPMVMSSAIVHGVSILFEDYMPALVPTARHCLSRWFAFHLINTNYQWPVQYWKHWEPFVLYGWKNSRGSFVKGALALMVENMSNPQVLVTDHLPKESVLGDLVDAMPSDESVLKALEDDLKKRIYDMGEDSELLLTYLTGDEVSESVAGDLEGLDGPAKNWWRSCSLTRALLSPGKHDHERLRGAIEKARTMAASADTDDAMNEGNPDEDSEDTLAVLFVIISQYSAVLRAALAKDAEAAKEMANLQGDAMLDDADLLCSGEILVLDEVKRTLGYSRTMLESCLKHLLDEKLVSPMSVVRWSLGDKGDDKVKGSPVLRWWELAETAMDVGVKHLCSVTTDFSQMAVDVDETGTKTSEQKRSDNVLEFMRPLLEYVVRRACVLYSAYQKDANGRKIGPEQVDLLEGTKRIVAVSHVFYSRQMQTSDDNSLRMPSSAMIEALEESAVAGHRLAQICSGKDGLAPVENLHRILERI